MKSIKWFLLVSFCFLVLFSSASFADIKAVRIPLDYPWIYNGDDAYLYYCCLDEDSGDLILSDSYSGYLQGHILNTDPDFDGWATITWNETLNDGIVSVGAVAYNELEVASVGINAAKSSVAGASRILENGEFWLQKNALIPYDGESPADCNFVYFKALLTYPGGMIPQSVGELSVNADNGNGDLVSPRLHSVTLFYHTKGGVSPSTSYNNPNPFNPGSGQSTEIIYQVDDPGSTVTIKIFTLSGKLVWQKQIFNVDSGAQSTPWDGMSALNSEVGSGVYLCMIIIKSPSGSQTTRKCKIAVQ